MCVRACECVCVGLPGLQPTQNERSEESLGQGETCPFVNPSRRERRSGLFLAKDSLLTLPSLWSRVQRLKDSKQEGASKNRNPEYISKTEIPCVSVGWVF